MSNLANKRALQHYFFGTWNLDLAYLVKMNKNVNINTLLQKHSAFPIYTAFYKWYFWTLTLWVVSLVTHLQYYWSPLKEKFLFPNSPYESRKQKASGREWMIFNLWQKFCGEQGKTFLETKTWRHDWGGYAQAFATRCTDTAHSISWMQEDHVSHTHYPAKILSQRCSFVLLVTVTFNKGPDTATVRYYKWGCYCFMCLFLPFREAVEISQKIIENSSHTSGNRGCWTWALVLQPGGEKNPYLPQLPILIV